MSENQVSWEGTERVGSAQLRGDAATGGVRGRISTAVVKTWVLTAYQIYIRPFV